MRFIHRLRAIWSWLPAFRTVAETEHLPTAAHELGIVASSLSRTVKQLEDELGVMLFDRTSKNLVLNESGRTLLVAVREAMRIVDDALGVVVGDELRGTVGAVASADLLSAIVLPAGAELSRREPALVLSVMVASPESAMDLLLRGTSDVAILSHAPPAHADLRSLDLCTWTRSVYGSAARLPGPYRCVVVGDPQAHGDDGWPSGLERSIAAWAPDERSALDLCARTDLVTVAFDSVVETVRSALDVTKLSELEVPPRTLYLLHRRALGRHRRTEALVDAIRAQVAGE